jgi:hypothetical protein
MSMRNSAEAMMLKHAGSNTINVDGHQFRYLVSENGAESNGRVRLALTVQHATANGSRLCVTGLMGDRVPAEESKFWMGRTLKRPATPKDVEQLVRTAISSGWRPEESGEPFILRVAGRQ